MIQERPSLQKWDGSSERFGLTYLRNASKVGEGFSGASAGICGESAEGLHDSRQLDFLFPAVEANAA